MKGKSIFDSLRFNAAMSILAVVMLGKQVIDKSYILMIIWIVLAYHFIKTTMDIRKK